MAIEWPFAISYVRLGGDLTDVPVERVGRGGGDGERLALDEDAEPRVEKVGDAVQRGQVERLAHHLNVPVIN